MQNIAIFGGTFNPVHWGHLLIAETALEQIQLDQVIWVPAYCPPHKQEALPAFHHRLEMVRRAIADHPSFSVSNIDAGRQGMSYAIATLKDLQTLHPHTQWFWIVGMDAFQTLPQWYESKTLISTCTWLVAPRPTACPAPTSQRLCQQVADQLSLPLRWQLLQMPLIGISSSLIRQACSENRSIRYLTPDPVRIYIETMKLYTK